MAVVKQLTWGSKQWREHLRRSLAQRKRYDPKNYRDIEGLVTYIENRGPARRNKKRGK